MDVVPILNESKSFLTHLPGQHAGPRGTQQKTWGNAQYCKGWACQTRTTNGFLIPCRNSRDQQCQDWPDRKPPRQWLHANVQQLSFPVALISGRHLGGLCHTYTTPKHRGWQRRPSSARGRPPRRPPPWRQLHDICYIPGLGAPKSKRPLGLSNFGRK